MHAVLRRESDDCNKDKYVTTKCLLVVKKPVLWEYNTKSPAVLRGGPGCSQSLAQSCIAVSTALAVAWQSVPRSQKLQIWNIPIVNLIAFWIHLHNCRCFQKHMRMLLQSLSAHCFAPGVSWEHPAVHRYTGDVTRSAWEDFVLLPDRFTFCWYTGYVNEYILTEFKHFVRVRKHWHD
jgi:hypothetical protein